jgi:DNA replication licensing factor MCM7
LPLTICFKAAFEDFLKTFKTTTVEATDALQDLNLNDSDLDDEYDFMDESGHDTRPPRPDPKLKYMRMLQSISDRALNQVLIDLDDLAAYEKALNDGDDGLHLLSSIEKNAFHYIEVFSRAVDKTLPPPRKAPE